MQRSECLFPEARSKRARMGNELFIEAVIHVARGDVLPSHERNTPSNLCQQKVSSMKL
jgi:hypothetical protein